MNNYIRRWNNECNINNNRSNYNYTNDCLIGYDDYELCKTITVRQTKGKNIDSTIADSSGDKKMKKSQARKKVMQIMTIRSLNPQRLTISRTIKDESLVRDLQQVIPNSQFYYSADTDKIYTVIADKVVQIGVVADE